MHTDSNIKESLIIRRNAAQDVESEVSFIGFSARGNTAYILFASLLIGVWLFILAFGKSIILGILIGLICPVLGILFIKKFIYNKPKSYFVFWVMQCFFGPCIHKKTKHIQKNNFKDK